MAKKQLKRAEVDEKYKWDLTPIFEDKSHFYSYLKEVKENINEITNWQHKIVTSGKNMYDFLEFSNNLERKIYRLYYYAHLNFDSDTTNNEYQKMENEVSNLLANYSKLTAFVEPEMMEIDYQTVQKYYEEFPKLNEYHFVLENMYRFKSHILSESEEQLLASLSKVLSNPEETFESLTDTDLKFGSILDENGEEVELTESNYRIYIASKNREVRKNAFTRLYETYSKIKNTITSTFKGNIEVLTNLAKIRKYNNSLESSLFCDNIPSEVYENLIQTVHKHMDVIYDYYKLKKECLNLDELHLYDIYTEVVKENNKKYTFEEAKEIVLNALSVLGDDYVSNLNKAFSEKWIDVCPNVGKRSGAYSSGFYDTNPYVLLNFEGKLEDVSTLAHELGHSMHTYYSCQNNSYQNSSYKIFVAEVASTVNELLLNKYMYKNAKTKEEKLFLLNELLSLFKATIYRQTMFAEFERDIHKKIEKGEALIEEDISNHYYELNKIYFGDNVVVDDLIRYEWERIPHFYYDFYVYKYAIGLSAACHIVDGILNNKENALESYLNFLKSGGSAYPIDELKIANVDVTKPDVIESALKMFKDTIEKFKVVSKR